MEKFQEAREKAIKNIKVADHMLTQTYPLVKDPKLLLAVMENIFLSLTNSIAAILYYERIFKRIPPFMDNFESKFNMFKIKVAGKYNFTPEDLNFILSVKNIIISHKKSPVEFTRKDVFVICNGNYKMQTISFEEIKKYLSKTKEFVRNMTEIVSKNEGLFSQENEGSPG